MEQLQLFEKRKPSEREARMAWIDARIAMFSTMTWEQRTEFVLDEVIARFEAGAAPLAEVVHWRSRLTPHQPDAAITPAGEGQKHPAAQVMFNG